jgi:acyl carrier protein
MSPHENLTARVCRVIAQTQKLPPESVTVEKSFEDLKIDSLDGINILFALEGEFNVDIPDEAAREIRSIREMVAGIEKLLAAKAGQGQLGQASPGQS